jgi:hypothetical protein
MGKTAVEGWQNTLYNDGEFSDWEIEAEKDHLGYENVELSKMDIEKYEDDLLSEDNSIDDEMQQHIRNMQQNNKDFDQEFMNQMLTK